jgi:pyridoxamine 5'-phosphate oxidase
MGYVKDSRMDTRDTSHHYLNEKIDRKSLCPNPTDQFLKWYRDAENTDCIEVNAMSLATASKAGKPSCRTVLLKFIDDEGLLFYTNYQSRKGQELLENPQGCAIFFWRELMRQVTVEGTVEKMSREESDKYFSKRPRGSQLGAWASKQGNIIPSREYLKEEFSKYEKEYENKVIPAPAYWGGFRIIPSRFEFWQGMQNRLHDRFQYLLQSEDTWKIERLSP